MMHATWANELPKTVRTAYRDVRVFVLGGTGFIGRHVAEWLAQCGSEVHVGVRDTDRAADLFRHHRQPVRIHQVDLSHGDASSKIIRSIHPTITFNLAGYGVDRSEREERLAYRINDQLVGDLAAALARYHDPTGWNGQTLVHVGSALEYGESRGNLAETTPETPTTLYGLSKLAGTRRLSEVCRNRTLNALTARLFTVYGPGEHAGRILPSLVIAARKGEMVPLTQGGQRRDFTFVADVVEGLLRLGLVETVPGDIVNLATGKLTTVRRFVETAMEVLQMQPEQLRFGALPTRSEEMEHEPVCIDRLRSLLDWKPATNIESGIALTRDWHDHESTS